MSGGSWDYVYFRVEEAGHRLKRSECPYRKALGERLVLTAKALHDIEWVDSADYGLGDDIESIKIALGQDSGLLALGELKKQFEVLINQMKLISKEIP